MYIKTSDGWDVAPVLISTWFKGIPSSPLLTGGSSTTLSQSNVSSLTELTLMRTPSLALLETSLILLSVGNYTEIRGTNNTNGGHRWGTQIVTDGDTE